MSYEEYIKALDDLKSENENRIIAVIPEVENLAYEALLEWMDNSLDTKGGSLIASEETIQIINDFDAGYMRVLNQMQSYKGAVTSFLKHLPATSELIKDYQVKENKINWDKANVSATENLVVNEIINAYKKNGLNSSFVQPLRDLLYQNISAGTSGKEAKQQLKEYIKGSNGKAGKLNRYLTQTTQQAVDSYTGAINKKLMDTFDYGYLIMSGSLIATSSPQCRYGINIAAGIISKPEWEEKIKPLAEKNGLIDGTTFKNLPFNKFHWGCRHEFTPTMVKPAGVKVKKHDFKPSEKYSKQMVDDINNAVTKNVSAEVKKLLSKWGSSSDHIRKLPETDEGKQWLVMATTEGVTKHKEIFRGTYYNKSSKKQAAQYESLKEFFKIGEDIPFGKDVLVDDNVLDFRMQSGSAKREISENLFGALKSEAYNSVIYTIKNDTGIRGLEVNGLTGYTGINDEYEVIFGDTFRYRVNKAEEINGNLFVELQQLSL